MVGANLHGGLVLGAFLPAGEAVAMSFAFLGRVEDRLCLYSQLTGVVPDYQSRGLGTAIKQLQRTIARAEGIERIAWAFDPFRLAMPISISHGWELPPGVTWKTCMDHGPTHSMRAFPLIASSPNGKPAPTSARQLSSMTRRDCRV